MFTVDHSKGEAFEPIKPGEYEATVINFEAKTGASGNERLVVDYEIRSDVERTMPGPENSIRQFHRYGKCNVEISPSIKGRGFSKRNAI